MIYKSLTEYSKRESGIKPIRNSNKTKYIDNHIYKS